MGPARMHANQVVRDGLTTYDDGGIVKKVRTM